MSPLAHMFLLLLVLLLFHISPTTPRQIPYTRHLLAVNDTVPCPLNFTVLQTLLHGSSPPKLHFSTEYRYMLQGLRLVHSEFLRLTGRFLPLPKSSDSCWRAYQALVGTYSPGFDIRASCGFQTDWISEGCMNITTLSQFEQIVPLSVRNAAVSICNQSLQDNAPCGACTSTITGQASYLTGLSVGNVSDCSAYPSIYAAAIANRYGLTDPGTAKCLFQLDFDDRGGGNSRLKIIVSLVVVVAFVGLVILLAWFYVVRCRRREEELKSRRVVRVGAGAPSGLDSFESSTHLLKFSLDRSSRQQKTSPGRT